MFSHIPPPAFLPEKKSSKSSQNSAIIFGIAVAVILISIIAIPISLIHHQ
jgi:hypothetical protein